LYYCDPEAPVRDITVRGVGARGYPLIKGRIVEMGSVSQADKRVDEVDQFFEGGILKWVKVLFSQI